MLKDFARNSRGFTLVEFAIVGAISSMVMLGAYNILHVGKLTETKAEALSWLNQVRSEIVTELKNVESFKKTALRNENSALSCLKQKIQNPTAVVNCSGASGPLAVVVDKNDKVIFDSSNPKRGFDRHGKVCDAFDDVNGNDSCPFRYDLSWRAVCSGVGCSSPDSVVAGKLKVKFVRKDISISPIIYGFNVFLANEGEKRITTCEQSLLGDSYSSANNNCNLKMKQSCPTGEYVVKYEMDGKPVCRKVPVVTGSCTGGQRMQGIDANGNVICVNWCQ